MQERLLQSQVILHRALVLLRLLAILFKAILPVPVTVRLDITAADGVWLKNDVAELETSLDLDISGNVAAPEVTGRITILEGGRIRFRDVEYRIRSGSLELLDLNFFAMVRCTRAAAPLLLESGGHIVNIGSLAAKSASRYVGAYPVSKHAVAAYSHQLRLELGPQGVHVLLVCPGPLTRPDAGQRYDKQAKDLPEAVRQPGGGVKVKTIP